MIKLYACGAWAFIIGTIVADAITPMLGTTQLTFWETTVLIIVFSFYSLMLVLAGASTRKI